MSFGVIVTRIFLNVRSGCVEVRHAELIRNAKLFASSKFSEGTHLQLQNANNHHLRMNSINGGVLHIHHQCTS